MKFTFLICCTFSLEKYHIELNYLNQQLRIQNQLHFCSPIGTMYTYGPRSNPIQCLLVPNPLENVTWISINHPGGIGWYLQSIGLYKKVCDPSESLGPQSTLCYAKHMQVQHTTYISDKSIRLAFLCERFEINWKFKWQHERKSQLFLKEINIYDLFHPHLVGKQTSFYHLH